MLTLNQTEFSNKTLTIHKKLGSAEVQVVSRKDLDGVESMVVEGVETYLGEVKNFKSHNYLKATLPDQLSISWTKMPAGGELPAHFHPCASMIIVTKGRGYSTGDTEVEVKEGDVIWIPEWNLHGFKGAGDEGFEALSVQFQETAIFESVEKTETTYQERPEGNFEERRLNVIARVSLPSLHEVSMRDGRSKSLGLVKGFNGNPLLAEKCPSFFSAAWVKLENQERLDPHVHDVDSMIIIANGEGKLIGEKTQKLTTGDVVFVPAGESHGFEAVNEGFWGLSIQFEEQSLYDQQDDRNVNFLTPFQQLELANQREVERFKQNPVFSIPQEDFKQFPAKKEALLRCLQVLSNHFQRLMYLRMGLCDQSEYRPVFLEHFLDELGHNTELSEERGQKDSQWSPVLEAAASWFVQKNFLLDDPGRLVMVQMVLEKGASIFYSHYAGLLKGELASEHIAKHCDADEGHDKLGLELLESASEKACRRYEDLLAQSWSLLDLFLSETAKVVEREKM